MFRSTSFRHVIGGKLGLAGLLLVSVTAFMTAPSGATTLSGVHVYGWGSTNP
jgi:hypothetical protein